MICFCSDVFRKTLAVIRGCKIWWRNKIAANRRGAAVQWVQISFFIIIIDGYRLADSGFDESLSCVTQLDRALFQNWFA